MPIDIKQRSFEDTLAACGGKADLVFTSPPYENARTYSNDVSFTLADYQRLGDCVWDALRPGGQCVLNLSGPVRDWRGLGSERSLTPWRVMLDWTDRIGFRCPDILAYGRKGAPGAYGGRFRQDWEPAFWLVKPGGDVFFDKQHMAVEGEGTYNRKITNREVDGTRYERTSTSAVITHRGTLWQYNMGYGHNDPELDKSGHPARFALRFAMDGILTFCPPEGTVCDPFTGAGTTALAAVCTKRHFIGGDLFTNDEGIPWADVATKIAQDQLDRQEMILGD